MLESLFGAVLFVAFGIAMMAVSAVDGAA